jgi:hypothetical protein
MTEPIMIGTRGWEHAPWLNVPLLPVQRERELERFLETIEPIAARLAGLLLRIAAGTPLFPEGFELLLGRLGDIAPLCVDLPDGPWRAPALLAALEHQDAGLAWHCGREPVPHPGGRMMVAFAPPAAARDVRRYIEQLAQWQQHDARAGLFFVEPERAARSAQEARLIAELMGV